MSVREFAVSRLHCFRSEARMRIAPLTLIYGQNNAGKSTLLRALTLFAASIGTGASGNLNLFCEAARGASFHELRSRLDSVNEMTFAATWTDGQAAPQTVTFRFMEETDGSHILRDVSLAGYADEHVLLRISVDQAEHYEMVRDRAVIWSGPLPFSGVRPEPTGDFPEPERNILMDVALRLDGLRSSVSWLTAVRAAVPRRRPVPYQEPPRRSDGAWTQEHLAREAMQSQRELIAAVSAVLMAMFDCNLHVDLDERDVLLRGSPGKVQWRVPLADLGEGITQILPVITLCCMAERGELGEEPILCMEQPEMHLHADAERELAIFLSRVAASPSRPRLVLETHSDILLSAVLLEVAEGRLQPEHLALHWVTRESAATESVVRHIGVDAKGNPEEWPAGALGQRSELARALFIARRR